MSVQLTDDSACTVSQIGGILGLALAVALMYLLFKRRKNK
jgi:LPXTG-motif cell wall-anchored protein